MIRKNWKKEVIFDMRALGSEFFFFLVFIRALIGPHMHFVYELVIAALVIFVASLSYKKFDGYIARGLVLTVFISMFYNRLFFYIFATLLYAFILGVSAYKLKIKQEDITNGFIVGFIAILIGSFGANLLI